MALLTITTLDDSGVAISTPVQIYLSDVNGNPVRAFTTTGLLVAGITTSTAANGVLAIDLPANTDITTPNTYYTVKIGNRAAVLIQKSSSSQTLAQAQVLTGSALGTAASLDTLSDVVITAPINGDYLRFNGTSWVEVRPPGPGSPMQVSDPLRSARAAWSAGLLSWLALGDSNTEGFYASTSANRYVEIAKRMLEGAVGGSAAVGYVTRHSQTNYLYTWTTSGAIVERTTGLGYGSVSPAAAGGYIKTTQTCDRFW